MSIKQEQEQDVMTLEEQVEFLKDRNDRLREDLNKAVFWLCKRGEHKITQQFAPLCDDIRRTFSDFVRKNDVADDDHLGALKRYLHGWGVPTDANNIYRLIRFGTLAYLISEDELSDVLVALQTACVS